MKRNPAQASEQGADADRQTLIYRQAQAVLPVKPFYVLFGLTRANSQGMIYPRQVITHVSASEVFKPHLQ